MENIRILVAQLGARRHYQQPALLEEWKLLDTFYTDFYFRYNNIAHLIHNSALYKHFPQSLRRVLERRSTSSKRQLDLQIVLPHGRILLYHLILPHERSYPVPLPLNKQVINQTDANGPMKA